MGQGEIPLVKSSKRKRLARFISDVANPLFLPPVVFLTLGWQTLPGIQTLTLVAGFSLIFYTVIPLSIVFLLLKKGHISSLDAPEQNTRHRLFAYSILSSAIGSIILFLLFNPSQPFLAHVALLYLINPIIGLLITFRWKVSIHTASLAMAATTVSFFIIIEGKYTNVEAFYLCLGMLLLLLPMIWARLHLNVHTRSEVLGGAGIGLLLTLLELGIIF